MKHLLPFFLIAALGVFAASCTTTAPETRTIPAVTPHSTLSDREITAKYLERLLELHALNKEMEAANNEKDFATVHAKAEDGLERAREARDLARHLDDPADRAKRLAGIDKIIRDLEKLVEMTTV